MSNDQTIQIGTEQPAQGGITSYGDKFDMTYTDTANWRARRDSLKGEGTVHIQDNHIFVHALREFAFRVRVAATSSLSARAAG